MAADMQTRFTCILFDKKHKVLDPLRASNAMNKPPAAKWFAAAKAFPSQIHAGADIADIHRFVKIIERTRSTREHALDKPRLQYDESPLFRLAGKTFNRLEWPFFQSRLRSWRKSRSNTDDIDSADFELAKWIAGRYRIVSDHWNRIF
jgi:hypothetical protein